MLSVACCGRLQKPLCSISRQTIALSLLIFRGSMKKNLLVWPSYSYLSFQKYFPYGDLQVWVPSVRTSWVSLTEKSLEKARVQGWTRPTRVFQWETRALMCGGSYFPVIVELTSPREDSLLLQHGCASSALSLCPWWKAWRCRNPDTCPPHAKWPSL